MNKWLSPKDVADLLQVSRSKAYQVIKEYGKAGGTVWKPTNRITRVNPEEFEKYLTEKK